LHACCHSTFYHWQLLSLAKQELDRIQQYNSLSRTASLVECKWLSMTY